MATWWPGGRFTTAGGAGANNIARWDGTPGMPWGRWIGGITQNVYALAVSSNGDLVAGGQFNTAGGVTANNIARWNGSFLVTPGSGDK